MKIIDENRSALAAIVFRQVGVFTLQRVQEEYRRQRGNLIVDGGITIHGYLQYLRDQEVIQEEGDGYSFIKDSIIRSPRNHRTRRR